MMFTNERGINIYAKIISLLFYPSFLQAVIASYLAPQTLQKWMVWILFLIMPVVLSLIYLKFSSMSKDHTWVVPKEYRILPLLFALIGTLIFFVYFTYDEPKYLKIVTLSSIFLTLLALSITFFWKISLHMIGMGGFTAFCIDYFAFHIFSIIFVVFFSIQVAWARMFLKSHDIWQILAGFFLGISCYMGAYFFYY